MINRTRRRKAIEAEPAEDQAPEPETVPADLAATADQYRRDAERAREQASQDRASAQALILLFNLCCLCWHGLSVLSGVLP